MSVRARPRTQQVYNITVSGTSVVAEEEEAAQLALDLLGALPPLISSRVISAYRNDLLEADRQREAREKQRADSEERRINSPA